MALNPYQVVTDGQTDRIPIANTRSQQYLPVQLSRVKTQNTRIYSLVYANHMHSQWNSLQNTTHC